MKKINLLLFLFALACFSSKAIVQLPGNFEMGKKSDTWKGYILDVSNPESWEETKFLYNQPVTLFGQKSLKTEIAFWNNRLYQVTISLPLNSWDEIVKILNKEYGKPWTIDTTKQYKSGAWGEPGNGVWVNQSYQTTDISFNDDSQKEFHTADLFHGIIFYIIVTIVGLFLLNYVIATLINNYCSKCKTFNMKYQQVQIGLDKNYSTEILGRDMHHDTTYVFKCNKCGHIRKDKYSGFMSYMRSKDR